jgi:hypothetical protein
MSRFASNFYLFSKLSVTMTFLLIIIFLGYALLKSYKNIDKDPNMIEEKISTFSKQIYLNVDNLNNISKRLEKQNIIINEVKVLLLNKQQNNKDTEAQVKKLFLFNEEIQTQLQRINLMLLNLEKQSVAMIPQNQNLHSIYKIAFIKYKNGESISEELVLMEELSLNKNNYIFEKLRLLEINKFYGIKNLINNFDESTKIIIKKKYLNDNQNSIINFIFNFVIITPNSLSSYENDEISILMSAKKALENEEIEKSLSLILEIKDSQKFFSIFINQSRIYLEYISELKKVI